MSQPITYTIQDKPVLTKVANRLMMVVDPGATGNQVALHPNIYNLQLPPSGQTEIPATKTNVFFDDFLVNESDLPGTGTLEERATQYVCNLWGLTII